MILEDLIVPLLLDAENYTRGLDDAQQKASGAKSGLAALGGAAVMGGIGAAAAGIGALTGLMVTSTKAAMDAELIQSDLNAVLESTNGAAGMSADAINDLATELSQVTMFEDDAIVSAEALMLTFTGIGKDVFPTATEAALNLSQKMGTDLNSSVTMIGKALNDPIRGITALTRVGVVFTDEQRKMVEELVKAGEVEKAQAIILGELETEFGGVARAAGETATGKLEILKNTFGNLQETIGGAVLPIITNFAGIMTDFLGSSTVQNGIEFLTNGITMLADAFMVGFGDDNDFIAGITNAIYRLGSISPIFTFLGDSIIWISDKFSWFVNELQTNKGFLISILSMIGVAIGMFVWVSVIPALTALWATFVATFLPAILVLAAVGAAVYLLYQAWQTNFWEIQEIVKTFWETQLLPVITQIKTWLEINIPIAIEILKSYWTDVLLPAIQSVWNWISTILIPFIQTVLIPWLQEKIGQAIEALKNFWEQTLLPAIQKVWNWINTVLIPFFQNVIVPWLQEKIPQAIQALSDFWTNTLLPAIDSIYAFFTDYIMPLFEAIVEFMDVAFTLALTALAGLWQNILLPAITAIADYISVTLQPIFEALEEFWTNTLMPALENAKTNVLDKLSGVFSDIKEAIGWVIEKIGLLTDALADIELPDWLVPGSPPPLYWALLNVRDAMSDIASNALPEFSTKLNMGGIAGLEGTRGSSSEGIAKAIEKLTGKKQIDERRLAKFIAQELARATG